MSPDDLITSSPALEWLALGAIVFVSIKTGVIETAGKIYTGLKRWLLRDIYDDLSELKREANR